MRTQFCLVSFGDFSCRVACGSVAVWQCVAQCCRWQCGSVCVWTSVAVCGLRNVDVDDDVAGRDTARQAKRVCVCEHDLCVQRGGAEGMGGGVYSGVE